MLNSEEIKPIALATACLKASDVVSQSLEKSVGMRELCWNNFRNNDGAKELRIILEF